PPRHLISTHTAPPALYTLSLHDALPIYFTKPFHVRRCRLLHSRPKPSEFQRLQRRPTRPAQGLGSRAQKARHVYRRHRRTRLARSEEHTSELQSRENLVCRLLLEKKKTK